MANKRQKTVFTNSELAHVWASRSQDYGRNGGDSFFFEGDIIYSWGKHFPVARFKKMPNGQTVVLYNDSTYSVSTTQHQSLAYSAVTGLDLPIISIPARFWDDYKGGRDYIILEIQEAISKSSRAKKYALEHMCKWYYSASCMCKKLHDWGKFHKRHPKYKFSESDLQVLRRAKAQQSVLAEKERKRQELAERRRQEDLKILEQQCGGSVYDYWRRFGSLPTGYPSYKYLDDTLCRIDGDDIVTSRGAKVPVSHAKRIIKLVKRCKDRGVAYIADTEAPLRIGYYQVRNIASNGDIQIGCHFIKYKEVELLGQQLLPELF